MVKKESDFNIGIIEDHVHTAESISTALEFNGFKTFQAYNGDDGIKKTNSEKPDMLIVDIRLNGVSGYDVAKKLPKYKILFITGYDEEMEKIKKVKNSVGVLQKPVDIHELEEVVRKILKVPTKKD